MSGLFGRARRHGRATALAAVFMLAASRSAIAQTTVALPDTGRTTTLTAAVPEQVRVSVPVGISFAVTDVSASVSDGNVAVSAQNIVLTTDTKQLRISLQANAASFMPPVVGATTWAAGEISWNAGPGGGPNVWV